MIWLRGEFWFIKRVYVELVYRAEIQVVRGILVRIKVTKFSLQALKETGDETGHMEF